MDLRRVAHWVIGLSVASVLGLAALSYVAAAGIQLTASPDTRAAVPSVRYTAPAVASVEDVVPLDDGDVLRRLDGVGHVVEVRYRAGGRTVTAALDWARGRPPPAVGSAVQVMVDPAFPERAVPRERADRARKLASRVTGNVVRGYLTALVAAGVLVATVRWAPRSPR